MTEIKSTLDLIMQKTSGLSLTEEEKRHLFEEELTRRGESLTRRYGQGDIDADFLLAEIDKENAERRPFLRETVKRSLVRALSLSKNNECLFEALALLSDQKGTLEALRKVLQEYQLACQTGRHRIEGEIRADLAQRGISGSAIIPKVESHPKWHEFQASVAPEFTKKLDLLKTKI